MKATNLAIAVASLCTQIAPTLAASPGEPVEFALDKAEAERGNDELAFDRVFTKRAITVDGVTLQTVVGGKGTPILLLHGWPGHWTSWRKVMPALAKSHTVIALDMPGFGRSTPLQTGEKMAVARVIHEAVKALGYSKIAIAGHDMGAPVGFAYAAQYPDEVTHFIGLDTSIPGYGLATGEPDDVMIVTPQRNAFHIPLFMVVPIAQHLIKGDEPFLVSALVQGSLFNKDAISPEELNDMIDSVSHENNLAAGFRYYQAWFADAAANKALVKTKLQMPALALSGTASFLAKPTGHSLSLAFENVETAQIDSSGHFLAEERPLTIAHYIDAFLRKH
jgi:pimeloyl-ACP methyl ester carboxylesterase